MVSRTRASTSDRLDEAPAAESPSADQWRGALRTLAHEVTVAETRERDRIARALHDDIGQALAAARFLVGELRHDLPGGQQARVDALADLLAQASGAVRTATFDLSSPALRMGLEEAVADLSARLSRQSGPGFLVRGRLRPLDWSEPVLAVVYRVVRELMLNVQRHAHARQAWVSFDCSDTQLTVTVGDDGVGIAPDWADHAVGPEGGFGLASASAQMHSLGGQLSVRSGPGSGTVAKVSLPLARLRLA